MQADRHGLFNMRLAKGTTEQQNTRRDQAGKYNTQKLFIYYNSPFSALFLEHLDLPASEVVRHHCSHHDAVLNQRSPNDSLALAPRQQYFVEPARGRIKTTQDNSMRYVLPLEKGLR